MHNCSKVVKYCLSGCLLISSLSYSQDSHHQQSTLEQLNLDKALYCMDIMENRSELTASHRIAVLRDECFAESYIQHSPHVPDGRDAVLSLFAKRFETHRHISTSIKRTATSGDLVWIHQHVMGSPEDRGNAVVNIFRMEDGKFVEHWNVVQAVPKTAKNNNTMF